MPRRRSSSGAEAAAARSTPTHRGRPLHSNTHKGKESVLEESVTKSVLEESMIKGECAREECDQRKV